MDLIRRSRRLWFSASGWRRRVAFWGGGLAVGIAAVGLAVAANHAQDWYHALTASSPFLSFVITPVGLAVSAAATRYLFPGSQGSGIPQAIAARRIADRNARGSLLSLRIAIGKICLTLLGLLCGASVGREGPTVQIGASIMHSVGHLWGRMYEGLILAGGAAGVAAAFNTPLAGIVFAIEEMSRSFEQRASGIVLTTVIVAGLASLALLGNYTYFGHTSASLERLGDWAAVPICGMLGGAMGAAFSTIVIAVAKGLPGLPGRLLKRFPVTYAACCGLAIAGIGLLSDHTTYGTGYTQAKQLLEHAGHIPESFGVLKMLATTLSSISGIPGGIFSPSLAVGAGLGQNVATLLPGAPSGAVILLGMVAYFAGVVQAPITAFVIVLEMTDNNAMTVPLMMASLIAYGTARFVGAKPIYHALSEGFLLHPTSRSPARPPIEAGR